ncbi:MAG: ABC transporter permease, partial [Chloroflexi bacterium]|nr:ABC transporter permease [Chloroflexota bacterium]
LIILLAFVAVAVFAPLVAPYGPADEIFQPSAPPSHDHLLGTTSYGQDIFSQLVWGARQTLLLGLIGGLAATAISVLVGVTSAYFGGWTDHVLSVFTDVFLVLPALPLMIIIAAYEKGGGFWVLVGVIVITGWSFGARQLRPQAQSLRHREFLESARVRGENSAYVILVELLPNMVSLIVAIFLGAALYAVLAAAGLQFIGLGDPNDLSWGTMLYWGENQEAMMTGSPLWIIAPGACIAALGAAVALINYGVDELGSPALRSRRRKRGRSSADS